MQPPPPSPATAGSRIRPRSAACGRPAAAALDRRACSSFCWRCWRRSGSPRIDRRSAYTFFDAQLRARNVKSIEVQGPIAYGEFVEIPAGLPPAKTQPDAAKKDGKDDNNEPSRLSWPQKFWVTLPSDEVDPEFVRQWRDAGVESIVFHKPKNYSDLLLLVWLGLLVFLVLGGWNMARRARDQMLGGGMLPGVLRSPARRYAAEGPRRDVQRRGRAWAT